MLTYDMIDNKKNRDFFDSLRYISDTFLNNTRNFLVKKFNDRLGCSCDIGLKNMETCSTAY